MILFSFDYEERLDSSPRSDRPIADLILHADMQKLKLHEMGRDWHVDLGHGTLLFLPDEQESQKFRVLRTVPEWARTNTGGRGYKYRHQEKLIACEHLVHNILLPEMQRDLPDGTVRIYSE